MRACPFRFAALPDKQVSDVIFQVPSDSQVIAGSLAGKDLPFLADILQDLFGLAKRQI
jgi:hypothetical protein